VRWASKLGLILGLAAVILLADSALFNKEWPPLLWHVRHGRHVELNGIRFTVPMLFEEDHGALLDTLEFYQFPGRFSKKRSAITIQFNKANPAPAVQDPFSKEERTVHFGEKAGRCVQYVSQEGVRRYVTVNNLELTGPADSAPTYIYCDFGDGWRASFSGSFNARDEFYAFLAGAKPVNE
jgi:hypothetical protein